MCSQLLRHASIAIGIVSFAVNDFQPLVSGSRDLCNSFKAVETSDSNMVLFIIHLVHHYVTSSHHPSRCIAEDVAILASG